MHSYVEYRLRMCHNRYIEYTLMYIGYECIGYECVGYECVIIGTLNIH